MSYGVIPILFHSLPILFIWHLCFRPFDELVLWVSPSFFLLRRYWLNQVWDWRGIAKRDNFLQKCPKTGRNLIKSCKIVTKSLIFVTILYLLVVVKYLSPLHIPTGWRQKFLQKHLRVANINTILFIILIGCMKGRSCEIKLFF